VKNNSILKIKGQPLSFEEAWAMIMPDFRNVCDCGIVDDLKPVEHCGIYRWVCRVCRKKHREFYEKARCPKCGNEIKSDDNALCSSCI